MKTIGIIAEYNPFHNGHAYQIKKIKEQTQADFCIVAMSGNFVQRGAPAIVDKYARAQMALNCGADMVVELPVLWATSSAEDFAMAGVSLFDKIGCVDGLCFGAETDDLSLLSAISEILFNEPCEYRATLSSHLKHGLNFPQARAKAMEEYFSQVPFISQVLNSPNNILALEYLKALRRRNSSIKPYLIKREGAGYHESEIAPADFSITSGQTSATVANPNVGSKSPIIRTSATAIRNSMLQQDETACTRPFVSVNATEEQLSGLTSAIPKAALSVLKNYCKQNPLVATNDFSALLNYRLFTESSKGFASFYDCNIDISNRLYKNRYQFVSYEQFCNLNKSKDITYTRMSRILLHILLGLTNEDAALGKELDYIPYFRLLGFRQSSASLLSAIKETSSPVTPMISKLADAQHILKEPALSMLKQDIFAAELFEQILSHKQNLRHNNSTTTRSEFTREIVLV